MTSGSRAGGGFVNAPLLHGRRRHARSTLVSTRVPRPAPVGRGDSAGVGTSQTDVIILKNGDRITCEIKSLARGMLTVKTDSMSTVEIRWPDIETIKSKFLFTLQDTQGQLYVGSLQAAADARHVKVEGPHRQATWSTCRSWRSRSSRPARGSVFPARGYRLHFTKASDRTQFDFSGDLTYRTELYAGKLNYSSTVGTSDGESDVNRKNLSSAAPGTFHGDGSYSAGGL